MPRIVFLGLFIIVAAIPFLFFGGLSRSDGDGSGEYRGGYYSRGPSFMFMHFGGNRGGGYRPSTGRGFSSGGFQGGGFRSGK